MLSFWICLKINIKKVATQPPRRAATFLYFIPITPSLPPAFLPLFHHPRHHPPAPEAY